MENNFYNRLLEAKAKVESGTMDGNVLCNLLNEANPEWPRMVFSNCSRCKVNIVNRLNQAIEYWRTK